MSAPLMQWESNINQKPSHHAAQVTETDNIHQLEEALNSNFMNAFTTNQSQGSYISNINQPRFSTAENDSPCAGDSDFPSFLGFQHLGLIDVSKTQEAPHPRMGYKLSIKCCNKK